MKSLLLAVLSLTALPLTAGLPLKIKLIGPAKDPVVIAQEQLAAAAPIARAAKEMKVLMDMEKLDEAEMKKLREVEQALSKGRALKQGLSFKLRFTNSGGKPVTFQYGPDTSTNYLKVEGPGAIDLPYTGPMTMEVRMPKPTTIAPGESKEFAIDELRYGKRDMSRWLISEPGTYTVSLSFVTHIEREKVEMKTGEVTFEVKAGE